jgi:hypothetical protein
MKTKPAGWRNPNTNRMKKLFLTSFVFKTGDQEYKEHRLVIVSKKEAQEYSHNRHTGIPIESVDPPMDIQTAELEVAYHKAQRWFAKDFPESTLIHCIAHPAIDDFPVNYVTALPFNEAPKE